jgi:hypothetical protein
MVNIFQKDYVAAFAWASAGKHFAGLEVNVESKKVLTEMADDVLRIVSSHLTPSQLAMATKRASLYISRFAPKTLVTRS